jgi:hypothetical protein
MYSHQRLNNLLPARAVLAKSAIVATTKMMSFMLLGDMGVSNVTVPWYEHASMEYSFAF